MEFSVVIPTYNRMDTLPEVLSALEAQSDAPPFEVVVVDDVAVVAEGAAADDDDVKAVLVTHGDPGEQ